MRTETHSPRAYAAVAALLLALLGATLLLSRITSGAAGLVIALGIAGTKAGLVAAYFMHLKGSAGVVRLFAAAGLFWLAVLIGFTATEALTR
jgi:cytochrome c oxidase subunit 4